MCEPFSVRVCVCVSKSVGSCDRTYVLYTEARSHIHTHTHTNTQDRNYSVLEHAFSIITDASCFHRYDEKRIRMHAHTHIHHTHKHTCISPLEVVDTTRDRYNIARTHMHSSPSAAATCAPKSVYITSFFLLSNVSSNNIYSCFYIFHTPSPPPHRTLRAHLIFRFLSATPYNIQ